MRKNKKLVHQLEVTAKNECDSKKMVKCFSRSAAGRVLNKPSLLRPPKVLSDTITYLLKEVLPCTEVPFNVIYDFIDDRLNAVRQDATIQQVSDQIWVKILPPIVRFHAYAAYRCYNYDVNEFDPFLNLKHFHECIFKLLKIMLEDSNKPIVDEKVCSEIVSLMVVTNLGNHDFLQQALPFITKKCDLIRKSIMLSLNISNGYFGQLAKQYKEFPTLHQCVIAVQLPGLRRQFLEEISVAYNSKNNNLPILFLKESLLHDDDQQILKECTHYGLKINDNKVEATKSLFKNDVDEVKLLKQINVDCRLCL
ncbi:SAC3 domain-containing protein 1 isoform X2 [Adelges cooleyi]|nr:SAC3 domain-containing protein 1 isoform X2 [Adelges cooleyi]